MTSRFLIYGLADPVTGLLRYVGKSSSGLVRPKEHLCPSRLKSRTHKACWMRGLVARGLKPNIIVLQEYAEHEVLPEAERFWVAYFRSMGMPLANHTDGGEGALGLRQSEESKRKKSEALKGFKQSPESSLKKRLAMLGKPGPNLGKKLSEELCLARARRQGRPFTDQNGQRYESIRGAARTLGLTPQGLHRVLTGERRNIKGYVFTYVEEATMTVL